MRSDVVIRRATGEELISFYRDNLKDHHVAVVDGRMVALAGLTSFHGRTWAFLHVTDGAEEAGVKIVRALRKGLRSLGTDVFVQCDSENAERLLTLIGFRPTDEQYGLMRVWKWQN